MEAENTISLEEATKNNSLDDLVEPENDLKNWLVEYVGEKLEPIDNEVTVGMIVDVLAKEFPEFVAAVAEENWVRGYHQALDDVEAGEKMIRENQQNEEQPDRKD